MLENFNFPVVFCQKKFVQKQLIFNFFEKAI